MALLPAEEGQRVREYIAAEFAYEAVELEESARL